MSRYTPDRRSFITHTAGALAGLSLVPDAADLLPRLGSSQAVKVAVIGCGRQGRAILAELQKIPQVEIAALCDVLETRLNLAKQRAGAAEHFTDHRTLLDNRPDVTAIVVATPTHQHRSIVEAALAAGRHVYCESPLAATVEDTEAMAAAASQARTICQAGYQARSNPTYRRAQPLVRTELRELISMSAQFHRKTSWRFPASTGEADAQANWRLDPAVSTGLAGEVGSQQFDVFLWCRGARPERIVGRGGVKHHRDGRTVADTIDLDLAWADGVVLRYSATLANSYGGQYEVINGINGSIRLAWTHGWLFKEPDAPTQGWEVYATRQQIFDEEGIVLIANATQLAAQGQLQAGVGLPHPSLYYSLMDFLRSVTENAPVACSMQDGAHATIVGIRANEAITTGREIRL